MDIEGSVKDPLLNDSKIGGRDKNGDNEDGKDEYDKEEESGKENSRKEEKETKWESGSFGWWAMIDNASQHFGKIERG